ncbi:hypothetical protein SAMN05421796_1168 [Chryseobacterium piscicola]|uniref:Uncharacterized protein n=1 Tax=Chryseobacterium piscicola TaxID=551459 RepID=A0A1N7PHT8_9FLAO|nr:hypothetical protein [Chryseobacterium piscicola]PQA89833.1 hypothetical protein B0A70_15485 [Chryseobacterium piscicola]SIT10087.1 hypothetical protein SAMN05421796_1168 [Chryseobacterium piscicola]
MKTNFELLQEFLDNTPKEKVLSEWNKTEAMDTIGPPAMEFLKWSENIYRVKNLESPLNSKKINKQENPEYYFGFSFN